VASLITAVGRVAKPYSDYFDRCRRKRNVIDYDDAFVATETEATEIVANATEFIAVLERWIAKNHPALKAWAGCPPLDGFARSG
jgi:uncharacterized protein (UPF0332 family)